MGWETVSKCQHALQPPRLQGGCLDAASYTELRAGRAHFFLMRPRLKRQHRIPEEATLSCSQRPAGDALNLCEKSVEGEHLMSPHLSQDNATAASKERKPISRASKRPCKQLRPYQDFSLPADEPSVLAFLTQHPRQKRQFLAAVYGDSALPKTRTGRRDPMKLAAAMERVRQWESRLLQNLEEATQHHLTVETETKKPVSHELQFNTEDQPEASSEVPTGHRHLLF